MAYRKVVCAALSSSLALTTSALDIVMLREEPGHSGEFSREMAFTVLYTETARPDPNMLVFILKPFQSLSKGKLGSVFVNWRLNSIQLQECCS